jgi:hypothetical protein
MRIVAAALAVVCCLPNALHAAGLPPLSPCVRGLDVPITVYNGSQMTVSELDAIVQTAGTLWRPYGVTLAPVPEHGVAVIVSRGSSDRDGLRPSRMTLGTTMFSDGHAVPYIHLWVGAAEALLDASVTPHVWSMPTIERDSRLLPMLGVALAHELGHFLLDTAAHTLEGMLQRVIPFRDLERPTPERLGLSAQQQFALCGPKDGHLPYLPK